jgi:hypothetical protein
MNSTRVIETFAIFGGPGASQRRMRRDLFVRFSQALLAASVTLWSINSPWATVLGALLFALLVGWLKARALRARRTHIDFAPEYLWLFEGWRAGMTNLGPHAVAADSSAAALPATPVAATLRWLRATGRSCKVRSLACLSNRRQTSVDRQAANDMLWSTRAL